MFFEKQSLRTRLTFEAGMASMGGNAFFMDQTAGRLDAREKLSDIAHNVERWVDAIVLRTYSHGTVEGMAEHACIPVINALSDLEHPCQALADYFTLLERFGDLKKICLAYVGDGNNVAHSLLLTAATLGSRIRIATPEGYEPRRANRGDARDLADRRERSSRFSTIRKQAVDGADAVYTDAWTSMGQEHEEQERNRIFRALPGQRRRSWPARRLTPSSCTACPRTAERKSRTRSWIAIAPWFSTRPKTACTCRRPFCCYCWAASVGRSNSRNANG